MYVKKNFMLWLAVLALALPLFVAGTASAKYMQDGAVQSASSGGWVTPSDGVCVLGLHADGTMDVDLSITNKRDCDARLITGLTGTCSDPASSGDGAAHANAGSSTCVTVNASKIITGTISLKNLDRDAQMCTGKGGVLANVSASVDQTQFITGNGCVAYGWQYRGQDASGAPLAIGAKGAVQGPAGFCSAYMSTGIAAASCPSLSANSTTAFGYVVHGALCDYQFGITGTVDQNNSRGSWSNYKNISGASVTSGTAEDLSTITTMGDCLAAGYNWNSWVPYGTTAAVGSITTAATFDLTKVAVSSDDGCLHCHSAAGAQYNGPAERFKDSYVQTGHKNMLRAVKAGYPWAGPTGAIYTTDGTNTINFMTTSDPYGKITVGGVDQNLYYVYGDWMAVLPSVVYGKTGYGTAPNGTTADNNGYSCYPCHATGSSDSSAVTNLGTINATGVPGVQSIGTPGYAGQEPAATFPNLLVNANNPKWDLNGINCSRCHNATVPSVTSTQIAASNYPTTAPTSGGMGALASGTGRTNLCFGCHQSIDKVWPAGTSKTTDPTSIATGVSHGAAYGRDFNGHVLGNSFLNSVHAEYTGTMTVNSLGNMDLSDPNGTSEYGSSFQGFTCWQGTASNSPAKTKADGTEIKTKSDCETLYGAGSWRADDGTVADGVQGGCSTCHDVHNSLFVASQKEAAMRKTCDDCHVNNATTGATISSAPTVSVIHHPSGSGTPFDSTKFDSACVVCHMASQAEENGNQNSMPVHVWRINTNASYNTFPTMAQFYGGSCSVHTGAVQNGLSAPTVYLSDISSANCTTTGVGGTWTAATKTRSAQTAPDGTYTNAVWVDLDLACGQCHGGSIGTTTYNGAPYISKTALAAAATGMHIAGVVSQPTASTPVVSHGTVTVTAWTVSFVDTSTSGDGTTPNVNVNWGDGSYNQGVAGGVFTHTYASTRARSYTINHVAISSVNPRLTSTADRFSVNVPQRYTVSGIVTISDGTTPMANAYVFLKAGTRTVQYHKTDATGTFSFSKVLPGNYAVHVYKFGTTFGTDATISGLSSDQSLTISSITP